MSVPRCSSKIEDTHKASVHNGTWVPACWNQKLSETIQIKGNFYVKKIRTPYNIYSLLS